MDAKAGSCFEVLTKVIKEDGLGGLPAEPLQTQLIYPRVWLAHALQAGFHNLGMGRGRNNRWATPRWSSQVHCCGFGGKRVMVEVCSYR